ncbi:MAG: hypothetical protein IJD74_01575 [Clostridia bacterium]|nr:hypothetical protein [Clostridia bacterium]
MNTLERRLKKETDIPLKPTDQCATQRAAYTPNTYLSFRGIILLLGIGFIVICALVYGVCTLFVKDDDWSAPEMLGEYKGYYYTSSDGVWDISINFTSCDKKGELEGTYKFIHGDNVGELYITGKITQRDNKGGAIVTITNGDWIQHPYGYTVSDKVIQIYDNYSAIRGIGDDMILFATDVEAPTALDNLYTPEIIKTYSGKHTPYNRGVADTKLAISGCDDEGNVVGVFEIAFEDVWAKWNFTGKITEKYSDGSLRLSFDLGAKIDGEYLGSYRPSNTMGIVIYDDYNALSSSEGFYWTSLGEELESQPEKTRLESVATMAVVVVILTYPLLAFLGYKILSNINFEFLTKKQKKRLAELRKFDAKNKEENQRNLARAKAAADEERKRVTARCARESADAELQLAKYDKLIAEHGILYSEDKNLQSVEFLIKQLESGRADTLKEALGQLDVHNENRKARFEQEIHQMQMNNVIRDAIAKAQSDQICHNFNVEQESRKQTRELEEIRKKLEE